MKNILFILLLSISFVSCKLEKTNKTDLEDTNISEKIIEEKKSEIKIDTVLIEKKDTKHLDTLLFVGNLFKFRKQNDYYLELSLKSSYSDTLWNVLKSARIDTVFYSDLNKRYAISEEIIEQHFSTSGLDTLLLINSEQEIYDTIYRNRFEFYDRSIESSYIATYDFEGVHKDTIQTISFKKNISASIRKSPTVHANSLNDFKSSSNLTEQYSELFSESIILHNKDTISIVSVGSYSNNKFDVYLTKNNEIKDSILTDYIAINAIHPVPLATEDELLYLYDGFKPDTDMYWTGPIGIDIKNWKLKLFDVNRIER